MKTKKILGIALAVCMTIGLTTVPAMAEDKKTFVFGDTTFNAENEEADINPQNTYAGWACIRYGVGETLFRYSDTMEIEPWIAKEYENVDELTWKITLNDGVGKNMSNKDLSRAVPSQYRRMDVRFLFQSQCLTSGYT